MDSTAWLRSVSGGRVAIWLAVAAQRREGAKSRSALVEPSKDGWSPPGGNELGRYLAIGRRWWWLLAAGTLVAAIAAFLVTRAITPTYKASATLLINQVQEPGTLVYNDILTSERLTKTYRELITKRPVLEAAIDADPVGGLTVDQLASKISASVVRDTQLVTLSATDQDPARAAQLANLVATVFVQQEGAKTPTRPGATRVVEAAEEPDSPVSPNLKLNVALAAVVGLLLAGGIVLLLEYLDDTLKTPEDVQTGCGLPTLGEVRRWHARKGEIHLSERGTDGSDSEAYAVLRTNVQFSTVGKPAKVVLVTSANASEGKSTTAANYALAVADTGKRVALIDSDLRRPSLHRAFGVDNQAGLTSALLQAAALSDGVLRPTTHPGLFLVTSGPLPPNPAELLDWTGFDAALEQVKDSVDVVVLDSPPVLAVADARILAAKADATVLVVDAGRTRARSVNEAQEALARANATILGVVLNKVRSKRSYYRYYYYSSAGDKRSKRKTHGLPVAPVTSASAALARDGDAGDGVERSPSPSRESKTP